MGNAAQASNAPSPAHDSLPNIAISAVSENDVREWTLSVKKHYNMPVCFIALTSGSGLFLKGRHGIDTKFVDESSICSFEPTRELPVIMSNIMDVPDCRYDPLVLGPPYARFYLGAPLAVPGCRSIGALCVMDTKPCDFFSLRRCDYIMECGRHIAVHLAQRLEDFRSVTLDSLGSNAVNGAARSGSSNDHPGTRDSLDSEIVRTLDSLGSFHQAGTRDELESVEPGVLRRIDETSEDPAAPASPSQTDDTGSAEGDSTAAEAEVAQ